MIVWFYEVYREMPLRIEVIPEIYCIQENIHSCLFLPLSFQLSVLFNVKKKQNHVLAI